MARKSCRYPTRVENRLLLPISDSLDMRAGALFTRGGLIESKEVPLFLGGLDQLDTAQFNQICGIDRIRELVSRGKTLLREKDTTAASVAFQAAARDIKEISNGGPLRTRAPWSRK